MPSYARVGETITSGRTIFPETDIYVGVLRTVYVPLTVSLQDVSFVPNELVALQTYSPASSGNTSLIFNVANLFLYFRSKTLDELIVCQTQKRRVVSIYNLLLRDNF